MRSQGRRIGCSAGKLPGKISVMVSRVSGMPLRGRLGGRKEGGREGENEEGREGMYKEGREERG